MKKVITTKEQNIKLIKETIVNNKAISRADIARILNLNKASVSEIVNELIKEKIVEELGVGDSILGRKPILLKINKNSGIAICLDIKKSCIVSSILLMDGSIVHEQTDHFKIEKKNIFNVLRKIIEKLYRIIPFTKNGVVGIAISIHGIVIGDEIRFSPFYDINNSNLKNLLESKFNVNVFLENEANLSVMGEKYMREDSSNIICITGYNGIGAGIMYNNTLFRGDGHFAGEIGHMVVKLNGKKCQCGNRGCIEKYASEENLLISYGKSIEVKGVTFQQLKCDYIHKIPKAIKIVDDYVEYMAIIINNVGLILSPEVIIINSNFANEIEDVISKIIKKTSCKTIEKVSICSSELGERGCIIGGFYLVRNEFLEIYEKRC